MVSSGPQSSSGLVGVFSLRQLKIAAQGLQKTLQPHPLAHISVSQCTDCTHLAPSMQELVYLHAFPYIQRCHSLRGTELVPDLQQSKQRSSECMTSDSPSK